MSLRIIIKGVFSLDIVNANQMYLTFSAGSIAPAFGLATVGATLVIAAIFALIPGRARGPAIGLLTGIALMFYVQGAFMNGVIGTLDGNTFDWHDFPQEAYRGIAIWGAVLLALTVLALIFPEQAKTGCLIACLALFAAQTTALVTTWVPEDKGAPNYQLSGEGEFIFSTGENILFITLDQFNPLIFEEQLEMDPSLKETFKDFLYFDNMSSSYSFTLEYGQQCGKPDRIMFDVRKIVNILIISGIIRFDTFNGIINALLQIAVVFIHCKDRTVICRKGCCAKCRVHPAGSQRT